MDERFNKIKETIEGIVLICGILFFILTAGYEYYLNDRRFTDYIVLIYSYLFLVLCSIHSLNPKLICNGSQQSIGFITNYKGKAAVLIMTGVLFYPSQNLYNEISNYVLIGLGIYCLIIECLIPSKRNKNSPEISISRQSVQTTLSGNSNESNKA